MLNSKSARHPNGLSNSSGVLGRYPDGLDRAVGQRLHPEADGHASAQRGRHRRHAPVHAVVGQQQDARLPARLPHRDLAAAAACRRTGSAAASSRYPPGGGYGKALKDDYRRYYGATVGFAGRGEMVPNEDTYCEIDPNVVDRFGIPVLRFHFQWSDRRAEAGEAHAGDLPRDHHRDGRDGDRRRCPTRSRTTARGGRPHHPRVRRDAHGEGSERVGAERVVPGARSEERRSSATAGRSCRRPTRTPRGRSWRSRCAPASTSPDQRKKGSLESGPWRSPDARR